MRTEKIIKIAALNAAIVLLNIIVFSDGLLHIRLTGGSAFSTALGVTVIFMSGVVFILGNYKLLLTKKKPVPPSQIKTAEDCVNALELHYGKKTFAQDIDVILGQIKRFQKKKETIDDILLQKFNPSEMSYSKFQSTILGVENVFYLNIKSILNKLNAFDEEEYRQIQKDGARRQFSEEFLQTKLGIYHEYIAFVKDAIEDNEQILLKLDKVLLEISKFNSLEDGEIENMSAMKEIDDLINTTKWYK